MLPDKTDWADFHHGPFNPLTWWRQRLVIEGSFCSETLNLSSVWMDWMIRTTVITLHQELHASIQMQTRWSEKLCTPLCWKYLLPIQRNTCLQHRFCGIFHSEPSMKKYGCWCYILLHCCFLFDNFWEGLHRVTIGGSSSSVLEYEINAIPLIKNYSVPKEYRWSQRHM